MERPDGFQIVRRVSPALLAGAGGERQAEKLLSADTGATSCTISYVHTPPGGGSPEGMHVHSVDQFYYVLAGTMWIQVQGGAEESVAAGSLVVFPRGVPHRNWNAGTEPMVHLAIASPVARPDEPFARPV